MHEKPLTTATIVITTLRFKLARSLCLIFVVALFALTLFGGSMLACNIKNGIDSMSQRLGADLLVVPKGYDRQFEGALLRGEPSSFYLDSALTEQIRALEGVEQVTEQLFIASLDADCCTSKVQLIGIDFETDFVLKPWLSAQPKNVLTGNEVIVGHMIFGDIGDEIVFYEQPFVIVGILEKTGMGFDTSVFMSIDTARELQKTALPENTPQGQQVASSLLVRTVQGKAPAAVAFSILSNFSKSYDVKTIVAKAFVNDVADKLRSLIWFIYGFAALLWLIAIGVLFLVFSMSFNERKREYSTLRVLGATRKKIVWLVLGEALLVCTLGGVLGILVAAVILFPFNTLISGAIGLPYLLPSLPVIAGIALGSLCVAVLIGPLASLNTALRLGRAEIYTLMRENE